MPQQISQSFQQSDRNINSMPYLLGSAILTIIMWQFPIGQILLYPFTILSIWFHEMSHGLMAMLSGGVFARMDIFLHGAGVAYHAPNPGLGDFGRTLVAAAGPIGPAIGGSLMILAGSKKHLAPLFVALLGISMIGSWIIWGLFSFGMIFIAVLGMLLIRTMSFKDKDVHVLILNFIGIQAIISLFRQLEYLFQYQATIGNTNFVTDSGILADATGIPHQAWGIVLTACSIAILIATLFLIKKNQLKEQKNFIPPYFK